MKLILTRADLQNDVNCSKTRFEDFKPEVQDVILLVGKAKYVEDEDRENWMYNAIYPPSATVECTGISANWCAIHGDCTCRDADDKNDDDCPLHSRESTHGEQSA